MTIGSNRYQLLGKIILLLVILTIAVCKFYFHISIDTSTAPVGGLIFGGFVLAMLVLLLIIMTLQLFLFPIGAIIDEEEKTLRLKFFPGRNTILNIADIQQFSTTSLNTKSTKYEGIIIQLRNGKQYILSDINLKDYRPIQTFLENNLVPLNGYSKFKMAAYLKTLM